MASWGKVLILSAWLGMCAATPTANNTGPPTPTLTFSDTIPTGTKSRTVTVTRTVTLPTSSLTVSPSLTNSLPTASQTPTRSESLTRTRTVTATVTKTLTLTITSTYVAPPCPLWCIPLWVWIAGGSLALLCCCCCWYLFWLRNCRRVGAKRRAAHPWELEEQEPNWDESGDEEDFSPPLGRLSAQPLNFAAIQKANTAKANDAPIRRPSGLSLLPAGPASLGNAKRPGGSLSALPLDRGAPVSLRPSLMSRPGGHSGGGIPL